MGKSYFHYKIGSEPVPRYKLVRPLGTGGFGEVWQARGPGGISVAIKFIDLTGEQGFQEFKSVRLFTEVNHANLVHLNGVWLKNEDETFVNDSDPVWSERDPFVPQPTAARPVELIIVMGLGEMTLKDRLNKCKGEGMAGIPASELLRYMDGAAEGIDYLNSPRHDFGEGPLPIIHSDIKPVNILIVGGSPVICDLGVARAVEAQRKTCMNPLTCQYAAPESFRGKSCEKSDQYSLAITYIELRTGALPFDQHLSGYEIMTVHCEGRLDLSGLLHAERTVIQRATAISPHDRWDSCRKMVEELRKAVEGKKLVQIPTPSIAPNTAASRPSANGELPSTPPDVPFDETPAIESSVPDHPGAHSIRSERVAPVHNRSHAMIGSAAPSGCALQAKHEVRGPPVHVLPGAEPPVRLPQKRMSTSAKLCVCLIVLCVVGGGVAYNYDGPQSQKIVDHQENEAETVANGDSDSSGAHSPHQQVVSRPVIDDGIARQGEVADSIQDDSSQNGHDPISEAILVLKNESKDSPKLTVTIDELPALLGIASRVQRALLASALAHAVQQEKFTPHHGVELLRRHKNEDGVAKSLAMIFLVEIPVRLKRINDLEAASRGLIEDCELLRTHRSIGEVPEEIRACHAECLLLDRSLSNGDRWKTAIETLGEYGKTPYYNYVRAQVQAAQSQSWDDIRITLERVFSKTEPDQLLMLAGRRAKLVELVNGFARHAYHASGSALSLERWSSMTEATSSTRPVCRLLKRANAWFNNDPRLDDHALAWLALGAAWDDEEKNLQLARTLTKELVGRWTKGDDTKLERNLAYAVYVTHWYWYRESSPDQSLLAARRMTVLANLPEMRLNMQEAKTLFEQILSQETTKRAAKHTNCHWFFDELADFIRKYPSEDSGKSGEYRTLADQIEPLYTEAIKLSNESNAEYFRKRGEARLEKSKAEIDGALNDAKMMEKLKASAETVSWLRGYAYFVSSRQPRKSINSKLVDLEQALKELNRFQPLKISPKAPGQSADPEAYAERALLLSMVHLERGNYSPSLDQKSAFTSAADYAAAAESFANQLVLLGGESDDHRRTLLLARALIAQGNAYEDLAYVAKVNVEENYKRAINAFTRAVGLLDSVMSKVNLARCGYRIIAESDEMNDGKPIPRSTSFLGLSRTQLLENQATSLRSALAQATAWDTGSLAEANYWLGRIQQVCQLSENLTAYEAKHLLLPQQFEEADKYLRVAITSAERNGASDLRLASYKQAWAEHALLNPRFRSLDSAEKKQALDELLRRCTQIAKLPIERSISFDPKQEAELLAAKGEWRVLPPTEVLFTRQVINEAGDRARQIEPADASRSDVSVMLLRRDLRYAIVSQPPYRIAIEKAETADDALKDALWLAEVPAALCGDSDKASVFNVARYFFGEVAKKPYQSFNNILKCRSQQVNCLWLAIVADPDTTDLAKLHNEFYELWKRTFGELVFRNTGLAPDLSLEENVNRRQRTLDTIKVGQAILAKLTTEETRLKATKDSAPFITALEKYKENVTDGIRKLNGDLPTLNHHISRQETDRRPRKQ